MDLVGHAQGHLRNRTQNLIQQNILMLMDHLLTRVINTLILQLKHQKQHIMLIGILKHQKHMDLYIAITCLPTFTIRWDFIHRCIT